MQNKEDWKYNNILPIYNIYVRIYYFFSSNVNYKMFSDIYVSIQWMQKKKNKSSI